MARSLDPTVDLAFADFQAGRYDDALSTANVVIALNEESAGYASLVKARVLIRQSRFPEAVATLTDVSPGLSGDDAIECKMSLAIAHAFGGDFASALYLVERLQALLSEIRDPDLRIEVRHIIASVQWTAGQSDLCLATLAECSHPHNPVAEARHVQLEASTAARNGDGLRYRRLLAVVAEHCLAEAFDDVPMMANTAFLASIAACEHQPNDRLRDLAQRLFDRIEWTRDLAEGQFHTLRMLSYIRSLDGDMLGAVRLGHRASRVLVRPALQVFALCDRAAFKQRSNEKMSALVDLEDALLIAGTVAWADSPEEDRLALLMLAEVSVPVDPAQASGLLAKFTALRSGMNMRLHLHCDPKVEAVARYVSGMLQARIGNTSEARDHLTSAFVSLRANCYLWRAAKAAIALYELDHDVRWLDELSQIAELYPRSWFGERAKALAADILGPLKPESADPAYVSLTPKQREVFRGLLEGLNAAGIADSIDSTRNTVRNHIQRVYEKFGVASQRELLAEVRRRRIA